MYTSDFYHQDVLVKIPLSTYNTGDTRKAKPGKNAMQAAASMVYYMYSRYLLWLFSSGSLEQG